MTKIALAAVTLTAALAITPLMASPAQTSRDFMTTSFETLTLEGDIVATLTHDPMAKIVARGSAIDIDRLQINRNGRTLRISMQQSGGSSLYQRQGPVTIDLSSADVERITLNGNAVLAVDRLVQQKLNLSLYGAGVLSVGDVRADTLKLNVIGNGNVAIGTGRLAKADLTVQGAARVAMGGVASDGFTLTSSGPTAIDARADKEAEVRATGTGAIRIKGGAPCRILYAPQASVECGGGYRDAKR